MSEVFGANPLPEGGSVIAGLKPGMEIQMEAGCGFPATNGVTLEIVGVVEGCSAVTVTGRRLCCRDGWGVKATGQTATVELSDEARRVIAEATQQAESLGFPYEDWSSRLGAD
jgi:hypothetical protein